MKIILTAAAFTLLITACNSGKDSKEKETPKDTTVTTPADTTAKIPVTPPDTATTNNDHSVIGNLALEMPGDKVVAALGAPGSKSKAEEWGADGLMHQDWVYKDKGITLNMSGTKEAAQPSVFSITVTSPSELKTKNNIGIGSTYEEVTKAYEKEIDKETSDKNSITIGSVYGGIIVSFKNAKAEKIFIGAAAE